MPGGAAAAGLWFHLEEHSPKTSGPQGEFVIPASLGRPSPGAPSVGLHGSSWGTIPTAVARGVLGQRSRRRTPCFRPKSRERVGEAARSRGNPCDRRKYDTPPRHQRSGNARRTGARSPSGELGSGQPAPGSARRARNRPTDGACVVHPVPRPIKPPTTCTAALHGEQRDRSGAHLAPARVRERKGCACTQWRIPVAADAMTDAIGRLSAIYGSADLYASRHTLPSSILLWSIWISSRHPIRRQLCYSRASSR